MGLARTLTLPWQAVVDGVPGAGRPPAARARVAPRAEGLAGELPLTGDLALDSLARVGVGDEHPRHKRLAGAGHGEFRFAGPERWRRRWRWRWRCGWCGSAA